ncbi:MAG: YqaJ viral recombinase family protein, partial [Candidatus Nanopelagicaceae bacterium]
MDARIIIEAEQRSEGWHNARLGMFTSSEIYKLMTKPKLKGEVLSEGAKTYILEKVAESLTGIRDEVPTTKAMQWGIDNEPLAKRHLARLNNWTIEETSFIKIESLNWGGSGDGWVRELNAALEVKCLNTVNHLKEIRDSEDLKANLPMRFWQVLS